MGVFAWLPFIIQHFRALSDNTEHFKTTLEVGICSKASF